jgi:3,4-dihydroxy-2-butanone 4-phosphate synthase
MSLRTFSEQAIGAESTEGSRRPSVAPSRTALQRVEKAIDAIRAARMVILTDDEERENEGDLCMAAEKITPAAVNFMAKYGRGLVCLSLSEEKVRELRLPLMVDEGANNSSFGTCPSPKWRRAENR